MLAVALVIGLLAASPASGAQVPFCAPAADDEPAVATFTLVQGETTELAVDRRMTSSHEIEFAVTGCRFRRSTPLGATTRLFRKGGASIDPAHVGIEATALGDEAVLTVSVRRDGETEPGRYEGAAVIEPASTLGQKVRVPMSITLQYRNMPRLALWTFLLTLVVGSAVVALRGLAAGGGKAFLLPPYTPITIALDFLAAGAGMLAAFGVWKSEYFNNGTWGAGDPFWDAVDLLIVMVAAFIAAATAATIATDPPRRRA